MLTVLINENRIIRAQKQFLNAMKSILNCSCQRTIGFQGGNREEIVYYNDDLELWLASSEDIGGSSRFWNPLGTQNVLENNTLSITVELNFPLELNRRVGAVFLKNENNEIIIGHRGLIGGSREGVSKTNFMQFYPGSRATVIDGNHTEEILIISALNSPSLAEHVKAFVDSVEVFKNIVSENITPIEKDFTAEPEERKPYKISEIIDSQMLHARVVNSLYKFFFSCGVKTTNTKHIDLCILNNKHKATHLFEVKSRSDLQSVYTAIGQLEFHAQKTNTYPSKIIVLPKPINNSSIEVMQKLDIHVVTFSTEGNMIKFYGLDLVKNEITTK